MKKRICGFTANFGTADHCYECASCGNHICRARANIYHGVCPHCFGRLFPIN